MWDKGAVWDQGGSMGPKGVGMGPKGVVARSLERGVHIPGVIGTLTTGYCGFVSCRVCSAAKVVSTPVYSLHNLLSAQHSYEFVSIHMQNVHKLCGIPPCIQESSTKHDITTPILTLNYAHVTVLRYKRIFTPL